MAQIDEYTYRNIKVTVTYNKEDGSFHASTKLGSVQDNYDSERDNSSLGFETPTSAMIAMENRIDSVLVDFITNSYEELAETISSFIYDINEGIDPYTLKLILDNFKP